MIDKIKVGEYIRTKYGIAKIIKNSTGKNDYFDYYIIDKYFDEVNYIMKEEIIKHSENILDLIKVKDSIEYIEQTEGRDGTILGETYEQRITSQAELEEVRKSIKDGGIKLVSVLTYEQFNTSTYKVGE